MIRNLGKTMTVGVLIAGTAIQLGAQQAPLPAVRPLGPTSARSTEPMGSISTAVPLPGGRVLVNDILNRRIVMFDSTLSEATVIADSTATTANAYGARGGGLISYGGDSALFIDPASLSMMVINGKGELTGIKAVPRATEINLLIGGPNGRPGFDASGRLVYRGQARGRRAPANARPTIGNFVMPEQPDSAPVVRVSLVTRQVDTIAMFKIPKVDIKVTQGNDGRMNVQTRVHPMPMTDDWALLADGSVAVVRGHDFHVDWIAADGKVTVSQKLPYEWQRLTDEDKDMVIDSARTAIEKQREEAQRMVSSAGGPGAFLAGGGAAQMMGMVGGGDGGGRGGAARGGGQRAAGAAAGSPPQRGGAGGAGGFQIPAVNLVNASELPDYRPAFGQQSVLGDEDGNLWIRTSAAVGDGGSIFYVVSRRNEVIDRIQLPQGRVIAGFGQDGMVYLSFRDTEGNTRLESARWK